jgi:hypothetical protein
MADGDIASGATWQINCSARAGGSKRIRRMTKADVDDQASVTAVSEVGPGEMVGFMDAPGAHAGTFEIRETKGLKPEIDWRYLKDSKELVQFTRQVVGGLRTEFAPVRIVTISPSDTDQNENTYTVTWVALKARPL